MEAIYVLSDPDSIRQNKYKVGITKRQKEYLLRDYRRSRPEVVLYLFENCENSKKIESFILQKFEKQRIPHESGTLSEWMILDVKILISEIKKILKSENRDRSQVETVEEFTVNNFISTNCNYSWYSSESCADLYNEYCNSGGQLNKMNFCRSLLAEITDYYKCDKSKVRIKKGKLTHYKGIQLKKNVSGCIII